VKVILVGDSIRMGYQPLVIEKLARHAEVLAPEKNGGDSRNVLANLDEWVLDLAADVLHLNCGLHDLKLEGGAYQVPLEDYLHNVHEIADRVGERFGGRFIWATTTPVLDEWHQKVKPFERHEEDVRRYNEAALSIMQTHKVEISDLHRVIEQAGPQNCLREDGVHMNERANELLSDAVASAILAPRPG